MTNLHEIAALQNIRVDSAIHLRPLENGDGPSLLAILDDDPSIRESVTAAARMKDQDAFEAEVALINSSPDLMRYSIIHDTKIVGLVSFWQDGGYFNTPALPNAYGFGYFLGPKARGKGIIHKSLRRLMDVASESLNVHTFMAYCEDGNKTSVAVLHRLGFTPTDAALAEPKHGWIERRYLKETEEAM